MISASQNVNLTYMYFACFLSSVARNPPSQREFGITRESRENNTCSYLYTATRPQFHQGNFSTNHLVRLDSLVTSRLRLMRDSQQRCGAGGQKQDDYLPKSGHLRLKISIRTLSTQTCKKANIGNQYQGFYWHQKHKDQNTMFSIKLTCSSTRHLPEQKGKRKIHI